MGNREKRGSDAPGAFAPHDSARDRPAGPGRARTEREELIAQAVANMGRLTGEQRDLLALLLPPPDQPG